MKNSSTQINPPGSVLLGMIGEGRTRGQVAILDIEACNNQNCAAIWVSRTPIPPSYIYHWLWSQYEVTRKKGSGNNQPALNKARVEEMIFPLPPLAEQAQIVAEVEEKLSNIEQMEATIEHSLRRAEHERQSILREAFAGRLVPQDPNDEPASVLLERIREERERREAEAKVVKVSRKGVAMGITRKRRTKTDQSEIGLYKTLVEAGQSLPPDDLFRRAGMTADEQHESAEAFYQELDVEVAAGLVREMRPDYERVLLEAVEPPPEELTAMEEEEAKEQPRQHREQGKTLWDV